MTLTFYKNLSDPRCATKSLTSLGDLTSCILRDEEPILTPTFEVASAALPTDFNYVYCDYTGRYYFTGDAVMVRAGLWDIPCKVDVLSTYYNQFKNVTATIARNENMRTGYMLDDRYKTLCFQEIVTRPFPNAMEDDSIILMTVG